MATSSNEVRSGRPKPLEDVTVLDLTVALAGPFATLLLAGLGAKVIKVENPLSGDTCRTNAPYLGRNGASLTRQFDDDVSVSEINRLRNKLGVTLDLKHPDGKLVLRDLMRKADVIVENFSRGTLDRLGAGYQAARELNPKVVYCSLTGFGADTAGPAKAMDAVIQALCGMMLTSGGPDDPPVRMGVPIADFCTPLFGVMGILAALHQAQRTGEGQHVDVSMLGAMTMLVSGESFDALAKCGVPARTGCTAPRLAPFGIYPARDGYVAICAHTEGFAKSLFTAIGQGELLADPRFADRGARVKHVTEVDAIVAAFTRERTVAENVAFLDNAGVPVAEVRDPITAVRDPRVVARGETMPLEHPKYGATEEIYGMGIPIKFSAADAGFDRPAPAMGEHNELVYGSILNYSPEKIAELKARGAI